MNEQEWMNLEPEAERPVQQPEAGQEQSPAEPFDRSPEPETEPVRQEPAQAPSF